MDGGITWRDQESPSRANLYAVTAVSATDAIAVGELGTVLVTSDGGRKWESQSNVTAKLLQAVVYRGAGKMWVAGRGGAILRRVEPLSPVAISSPKLPPVLGGRSIRLKPRTPLITIPDDGDIPVAVRPPEKPD
jgi:hypothetical protein